MSRISEYHSQAVAYQQIYKAKMEEFNSLERIIISELVEEFGKCSNDSQKKSFEANLSEFKSALYEAGGHHEFGKRWECVVRKLLAEILPAPDFQVELTAKNKIGDILIKGENGDTVVIEMKSYVAKDSSAQGLIKLKETRQYIESTPGYCKYIVFAGWSYFNVADLTPFIENQEWLVLQSYRLSGEKSESPIWKGDGFANYFPFHVLTGKIRKALGH